MMMFALLNYDNLSSILDYLFYIDIYQLNCALLCSNWHLPLLQLLKNYLQTIRIECIFAQYVNTTEFTDPIIPFYCCFCSWYYIKNIFTVNKYKQILLWVYDCEIQVDTIEIYDRYHDCSKCRQLEQNYIDLDIVFKIPANNIYIESTSSFAIDKLNNELIESTRCRDSITTLKLYIDNYATDSMPKTDLMNWPILPNLEKLIIKSNYYLTKIGYTQLLNGCPNIKIFNWDYYYSIDDNNF